MILDGVDSWRAFSHSLDVNTGTYAMAKNFMHLSVLAIVAILAGGCGNPIDPAVNSLEVATVRAEEALKNGNQTSFISAMSDMATAMNQLASAVEAAPEDRQSEYNEKVVPALLDSSQFLMSSECADMMTKISAGPDAYTLGVIITRMKAVLNPDG